jgi:RNA polymerase sigma factor (sigma-70 family)
MATQGSAGESAADGAEAGPRLAALEGRLRLYVLHLAGPSLRARVELADLVQDVYLRALASPRGLPDAAAGELALWGVLARLAREVVIDAARALRAARRDGRTERLGRSDWSRAGPHPAAAGLGPHSAAGAREESSRLAQAYLALTADHRRVLGLRQFAGLSAEEVAKRMGRSASAVHSLYRRALEAWQTALERKGVGRDESGPSPRM